ncbi:MAG: hydrolase [Planctomycetota bacterium]|nr:MAG: hydrolase [Planctomycetota bacterium]
MREVGERALPLEVEALRPDGPGTALIVIDVQERLFAAMEAARRPRFLKAVTNLVALARAVEWPIVLTEQYPQGLGPTVPELRAELEGARACQRLEKLCFSACAADGFGQALGEAEAAVLCGMEAHICVLETALDLLGAGRRVFVPWDGVLSRERRDQEAALDMLRAAGAIVTSSETVAFQVMKRAGTPLFRQLAPRLR